jgi:hypothetical protein
VLVGRGVRVAVGVNVSVGVRGVRLAVGVNVNVGVMGVRVFDGVGVGVERTTTNESEISHRAPMKICTS